MLIQPNAKKLGDGYLSGKESLEKWRAEEDQARDAFRLPRQEQLAKEAERIGRPMLHTDLIKRIRAMTNYAVWAEDSINWPGGMNLYKLVDGEKKCLSTPFEKGFMPEYTVLHLDEQRLPGSRTVGWREVLLRLIQQQIVTHSKVRKFFPSPSPTPVNLWRELTQQYV